ncbi:MAG: arsenate reductase ArsC [Chloroflexota bacterium]|nr:arsenate reductase ArsC [Chloroflexota bacterium]
MAEGLLRSLSGGIVDASGAGTVATAVRPEAIEVMRELGIDISMGKSKTLDLFLDKPFDIVVTVCDDANDTCPIFPGARERLHWSIEDPSRVDGPESTRLTAFRTARDELRRRIESEILPVLLP